jgi:scyllo-inositol 2-dehydrogenase (NADP+)
MVRFGIIGTNWITDDFIKAGRDADGFSVTAVYSRTEERAKLFAEKHNIPHTYTDIAQFAQSDAFDAVYIASPNSLHAQQAKLCMSHGKHVLCEKPIASNAAETRVMFETARKHDVLLMEAMKSTMVPNFLAIQENLSKLGKIRRYFASYCQYSSRYDAYKGGALPNAFNPDFSNGSLMDLGIYCLYPLIVLFGKPDRIQATAIKLESGVDAQGSILLQYADMEAAVMYSKISNSSIPSEIQGEDASMIIHRISQPAKVEIVYRDGKTEELTEPQHSNTMVYEIREFIGLIRDGRTESTINSFANSLAVMEVIDEARRQIGLVYPADRE